MIRRIIGILTAVAVVCGGEVVLESRAADPRAPAAAAQRGPASQNAARQGPRHKVPTASPAAAKSSAPGAPQVPEESATIRDDPTIAPDPKQSADNNVSFPNDI